MKDCDHVPGGEWCGSTPYAVAPPGHKCQECLPESCVDEVATLTESMVAFTARSLKEGDTCVNQVHQEVRDALVRKLLG